MKDETDEFEKKSADIRELGSLPPHHLTQYLTGMNPDLDQAAPNMAPYMYASSINAIQFLHSKLPRVGEKKFIQDELAGPSPSQKMKWLDLYNVANDPISIFDHIEKGIVTNDQIQAVKSIYPSLYQEMSLKLAEQLGKMKQGKEQLPYGRRMAISKFLGMPLDSTMDSSSMQAIIKAAGPNTGPAAQAEQQRPSHRGGRHAQPSAAVLKQISKADDLYKTQNEALESSRQK